MDQLNNLNCYFHFMKKRIFVLRKFVKSAEKIIFSIVSVCFSFREISYILSFPSNENVGKQHLSAIAYFCVNMKLSYMIAECKDEICRMSNCNENKWFFAGIYFNFLLTILNWKDEIFCRITAKASHWSTFRWRCLYFSDNILQPEENVIVESQIYFCPSLC